MLAKWPIRNKLFIGLALLFVVVSLLSWSAFYGLYAFRGLLKSLERVDELRLADDLAQHVCNLRIHLSRYRGMAPLQAYAPAETELVFAVQASREEFRQQLELVRDGLHRYRAQLLRNDRVTSRINDNQGEQQTVREIEAVLLRVETVDRDEDWLLDSVQFGQLDRELERLQELTGRLPGYLHRNIKEFTDDVRDQRRNVLAVTWTTSIGAVIVLGMFLRLHYRWVFRPLRVLIKGSRKIASGQFTHRIQLYSRDEMAELADALNDMTDRFQTIRDDLDRQVQERTRQVVRSEQLASVGFLAAGVAHEINNPLASIAMCAESLERRTQELLDPANADHGLIANYLRMIQDEAFRCKEITEKLLDFSRMGDLKRHRTDLGELVQGVIDMVRHLGRYHDKQIEFVSHAPVIAEVNAQEIKQVVLNLLTNALDSLDQGGTVTLELYEEDDQAVLWVRDDGCGMTEEVLSHLFEPFFTRRRNGQGTGLGLSITYRIVAEHGGQIEAASAGPGCGSQFRVSLALSAKGDKEVSHRYQAA